MKKIKILMLLGAVAMMVSCEKKIEFEGEDVEPMVVVHGLNDADNPIVVNLCYSRPIYSSFYVPNGGDYFEAIDNANVTLTIDGSTVLTAADSAGRYSFAHTPQPGEHLVLDIEIPGKEPISAVADVMARPAVRNVESELDADDEYTNFLEVSFDVTDKKATSDYYAVRLRMDDTVYTRNYDDSGNLIMEDTSTSSSYVYYSCTDYLLNSNTDIIDVGIVDDPTGQSSYEGTCMTFTDATFNGQTHHFKVKVAAYNLYDDYYGYKGKDQTRTIGLYLEVSSMSRDLYLYRQTSAAYSDDEFQAILSEPVQIHSNIEGGIGIFGVSSTSVKRVEVPNMIYY